MRRNPCTLPSRSRDRKLVITIHADVGSRIEHSHYALVPSDEFSFTPESQGSMESFRCDWEHLQPDPYMADGGCYRFRRYGLFQWSAGAGVSGHPTPEGVHRDDETYTAQHLIARHNIAGGINHFYGSGSDPTIDPEAVWEQTSYFDSYYFDRSIWHSVSPIDCRNPGDAGHRDVILIDFVNSSEVH